MLVAGMIAWSVGRDLTAPDPDYNRFNLELVRRGIGGRTEAELKRRMTTRERARWVRFKRETVEEKQAAAKRKEQIIEW